MEAGWTFLSKTVIFKANQGDREGEVIENIRLDCG